MPHARVLVVDDDGDVRALVHESLSKCGYEVVCASSGEECISLAASEQPDLIVLDIDMPGLDGIETCRLLRRTFLAPVILLSSSSDETDAVLGLRAGGDCCLKKPLSVREMLAYVDAALRREKVYPAMRASIAALRVQDLVLDIAGHECLRGGKAIYLTPTEFRLVHSLAANAGRVLTRDQLLDAVWEHRSDGLYTRTIDVHIGRLRRKIELDPAHPRYIVTVPGLGYKMPR